MTGQELWASLLQEAIQGRLVEQRDDEPDVPQIGDDPEDVPFAIPEKWKWVTLSSVCISMKYGTAKKSNEQGLIPVIRMGNIQNGEIIWDNLVYSDDKEDIEKFLLSKDDVLFNRTNSPDLVGKTAIYRGERKAIYAGYIINIKYDRQLLYGDYLNYVLNSQNAKQYCNSVKTNGVCQANINAKKIGNFCFPLPPLAEQRRIVARLGELRPLVDDYGAAEAELTRLEAELPDKLRASLLQEAISGRLVEQRDDEPAVEQIGDAPEDVPFAIPEKWKWSKLGDVLLGIQAGKSYKCDEVPPADDQCGLVKVSAVTWGEFDENESKTCFSNENWVDAYAIHKGDFLISRANTAELVGSCVVVNRIHKRLMLSDKILRLKFSDRVYQSYVLYLLRSPFIRSQFVENATGTSNSMKNISQTVIRALTIPLPPLAEQRRIVARLEELLPEVARLAG